MNLSYLHDLLMGSEADDDDAMFQVDDLSYQATFTSFSHLLPHQRPGAHPSPSCDIASSFAHPPHQGDPAEQHIVRVVNPSHASSSYTHITEPQNPVWALALLTERSNGHMSSQPERGQAWKHTPTFQGHGMASHSTILSTSRFPALEELGNSMPMPGSCLNEDGALLPSDHLGATVLNQQYNRVFPDVVMSSEFKDALVEDLMDDRCTQSQEQVDDGIFKLCMTKKQFSSKLAEVEVPFKDLKLNDVCTDFFVGELKPTPATSTGAARHRNHIKHTKAVKRRRIAKNCISELCLFVDVREVLLNCAQAVAIGDARRATEILQHLSQGQGASAHGTSLQRIAHFFSAALTARMKGIGEHLYSALSHKMPSALTLVKATKVGFEQVAFVKINQYFANQSILKAAEGASRLHIVDYGLLNGIQWPCLIHALADRKGGPPLLVITGIESQEPGVNPAKRLERSGQQLAAYAKAHNVPFQYHAIICDNLGDLDVASLNLHEDEVLVVNYIRCLHYFADESVDLALSTSPRQKLLTFLRSLNPHLLLTYVMDAAYSTPFFVSRFREALNYYSNVFDMLEAVYGDIPQRHKLERSLYCSILNVVACEGAERVERPETHRQWHARLIKAGFEQLPISPTVMSTLRSFVKQHYHKEFLIHDDGKGWVLMGWKGYSRMAISAWRPSLL